MRVKIGIVIRIILFSILLIGCTSIEERRTEFISKVDEISDETYNDLIEEVYSEENRNGNKYDTKKVNSVRTQKEMWTTIHHMANTKIIADKIRGEIEITPKLVKELICEVNESDYDDKLTLLNILNNWLNENFENAVDEHNYVWSKLEGEVGWAKGKKAE